MEKYDLRLTGKEVQFNLSNNLDKDFYLDDNINYVITTIKDKQMKEHSFVVN